MPTTCIRCRQLCSDSNPCKCVTPKPQTDKRLLGLTFGLAVLGLLTTDPWSKGPLTPPVIWTASGEVRVGQKWSEAKKALPAEHCMGWSGFRSRTALTRKHHFVVGSNDVWIALESRAPDSEYVKEIEVRRPMPDNPLDQRASLYSRSIATDNGTISPSTPPITSAVWR